MTEPLRLGLLSTARINELLLAAAAAGVEVVAVASRDAARAEAYARARRIRRAHGSYDALLADPAVDAVYVSLPTGMHHAWTMRALAAGKHVLCEKPYSARPDEVEEAWAAAAAAGLVVAEALMHRHHPQTGRAEALVAAGAVGRLRRIRATHAVRLLDADDVRLRPDLGGGALLDLGCYCASGARLLAGEPERVLGERVLGPTGVDLDFVGVLRFADGVVAQLDASFTLPSRQRLEAAGDEGTLVLDAPWRPDWGFTVTIQRGDGAEPVDVPQADAYGLELEDFAAAVRGERAPLLGRDDALGQARTLAALLASAESGRAVAL